MNLMDVWEECRKCGTRVKSKNMGEHMTKHGRRMPQRRPRKKLGGYTTVDKVIDSKWWNRGLVVGIIVLVIVLAVIFWPVPPKKFGVGDQAPELIWDDGTLSDFQGRLILVTFYGTNSTISTQEHRIFVDLYQLLVLTPDLEGRESFVDFISVDIEDDDTEIDILTFKAEIGALWQFLLDASGRAEKSYHVRGVPITFILDKNLMITNVFEGSQNYNIYFNALFDLTGQI